MITTSLPAIALHTFLLFNVLSADLHAAPDNLIYFDIPSGELSPVLIKFSEQSGLQIFYRSELSKGNQIDGLTGLYSAKQALELLLSKTSLLYEFVDENTISIQSENKPVERLDPGHQQNRTFLDKPSIEEILVTGSYIRRVRESGSAYPILILSDTELGIYEVGNTAEIVQDLTISTGSEFQVDALNSTETIGTANINLRGLGLGSTLVLLNGQRQTLSAIATQEDAASFVDISSLPPKIMIEKVEILKDGASAIYGTDSVAGVVNFITYKDFTGLKLQGGYQTVTEGNQSDKNIAVLYGNKFDNTNIVLAGSYLDRSSLATTEKDFTENTAISSLGQPGTFLTSSGFVADPGCMANSGILLDNGFCGFDITPFYELRPSEENLNLSANLTHHFDNDISAYLELGYVYNKGETTASASFPFAKFNPVVPISNPGNTLGEPVQFFGRVLGAEAGTSAIEYSHKTWRVITDVNGKLANDWDWKISLAHSTNNIVDTRSDVISDRLVAALNGIGGPGGNEFFNPFAGAMNSASVIDFLFEDAVIDASSALTTVEAVITGDILKLPSGNIDMAVGIQYRKEDLDVDFDKFKNADRFMTVPGGSDFDGQRNIGAVFTEINLPLNRYAEIQAAARYSNYAGDIDTLDPKVALLLHPHEKVSLRGSYSTSFRAPSLVQTIGESGSNRIINDPLLNINNIFRTVTTPGNDGLDPETAEIFNFGMTLNTDFNIRIDFDYWHYEYTDVITKENPQDLIDRAFLDTQAGLTNTEAQNKIMREPVSGAIQRITTDFINAASVSTNGFDLSVSHIADSAKYERFLTKTEWSFVNEYDIQEARSDPVVKAAGNRNFLNFARPVVRWRGNTSIQWVFNAHHTSIDVNYIGSYADDENNNARIGSHTTVNLQYKYTFANQPGNNYADIAFGIRNILDTSPPRVQTNLGFDTRTHDPRGRLIYLNLTYTM